MELSDHAKSLALELLNRYDSYISSALLFEKIWCHDPSFAHYRFTGLHCASYFGIDEIVATLTETRGCDINQGDCMGVTPLMRAAQQGHQGVVRLLLTRSDVNTDEPDKDGLTPLW